MDLSGLLRNPVLHIALIAWLLAQLLKLPFDYLRTGRINLASMLNAGGMPSSHSALITSATHAIGLYYGYDSPLFALSLVIALIVVYDAAGVRRQAGIHAMRINILVQELLKGHPLSEYALREVLGHSPLEVVGGVLLGILTAQVLWYFWT